MKERFKKWLFRLKMFAYAIAVLFLLIVIFENTQSTSVYFLTFEFSLPLSLWLLGTYLLGSLVVFSLFLIGWLPFYTGDDKNRASNKVNEKVTTTTVESAKETPKNTAPPIQKPIEKEAIKIVDKQE